jgi:hypothetical protein
MIVYMTLEHAFSLDGSVQAQHNHEQRVVEQETPCQRAKKLFPCADGMLDHCNNDNFDV